MALKLEASRPISSAVVTSTAAPSPRSSRLAASSSAEIGRVTLRARAQLPITRMMKPRRPTAPVASSRSR